MKILPNPANLKEFDTEPSVLSFVASGLGEVQLTRIRVSKWRVLDWTVSDKFNDF